MQFKKYKIISIVLGVWIVLFVFGALCVNFVGKSGFVENIIFQKTGLKYETQNLKTGLDAKLHLNISADFIKIYNKDKTTCFITFEKPNISIRPISLIFNKIYVSKFNSNSISVKINRDEKGEIDLLKALNIEDLKQNKYKLITFNSNAKKIDLRFDDNYNIKSNTTMSLNDSLICFSNKKNKVFVKEKGTIETSINNQTPQKQDINISIQTQKQGSYDFDINLNNINLYLFSDLLKKYISKDIKALQGIANLNLKTQKTNNLSLEINGLSLLLQDGKMINPYKEIKLTSDFVADNKKITINDLNILSNNLFVNLKGEILKPFSKKPDINLSIETKDTQINNFLYFIPDNLIYYRPQGIPTLKKSNFHGLLNGNINLKLFPLDITGTIKAQNIHIPNYPKPSHQNDVTLIFMKDKMRVYTRVYTPDNEYVIIDGVSNLDDSLYGKYSVKSTQKIDLSFAQLYLVPIQQIIGFNIGPVPIMDIKGYGNIDIKTQGTIKDAQIFGQFSAYSASALIHGLDAKLTNGKCKLVFDNRNLLFKEIKGSLDGADFLLTGIGNTKGEVDLSAKIQNAYLNKVLKILNNSVLTEKYRDLSANISAVSGLINSQINLKGTIKDYEKEDFLNSLALSGNFELKNNKIILNNGTSIKNITGIFNFDEEKEQNGAFEFFINKSKFNTIISSKTPLLKIISNDEFDINVSLNSAKCAFSDLIKELSDIKFKDKKYSSFINELSDIDFYSKISLVISGKLSLNNLDFNNLKANGYIVGLNSTHNKNASFEKGLIRINNNNITFDNFTAHLFNGDVTAKGSFENGAKIYLKNINLYKFEKLFNKFKLQNAKIKSGEIYIHKNIFKLNAINIDYNNMPVVLNLASKISSKIENFEAEFSTILNETTTDYIINPYLSYPIKVKGEIPLKGKISGNLQNYFIDFKTSIPKDSDISFSGANIGDTNQDREISGKINVNSNILSLNNLKLVKYIKNQNNKTNIVPSISLNGKIIQNDKGLVFDNLKIITFNPVNVRMLNSIFKKSILKKGNFECNLSLNGNINTPSVAGNINLQDLDIPLYDIKINNIKISISQKYIDAVIEAKNKLSDIHSVIKAVNGFQTPFIINKIVINSNKLDIQDIIQNMPVQNQKTDISTKQDFSIKASDVIVKDGSFAFDDVSFDKINAKNLKGNFSYKDEIFDLKNIFFNIANGEIKANGNYNIKTTKLKLGAEMNNCDANILAKSFLNLKDQIYGKMTGTVNLTAKHLNTPEGIKNISSNVEFSIDNGKMPKLGSLEYLLRAGNILRNGILGLSINNLIQVLTPYKTGEFEKISGKLNISEAKVKNLEIFSKGKNLSMYLFGEYDILETMADIKLYGRLSQSVSNSLGSVGNASIKQFINSFSRKIDSDKHAQIQEYLDKIPLVDSSNQGGYFSAKVFGDINKDNYIKKFNWE